MDDGATPRRHTRPTAYGGHRPRRRRIARVRELTPRAAALVGASGIVIVLALWQLAAALGWVNPYVASSPLGVAEAAVDLTESGRLGPALLSTAQLFLVGFGVSLLGGLVIGAVTGWNKVANAIVDPWVSILFASPRIAFLPLIAVWFGPGFLGQTVVVITIAIFPIIINVAAGVGAVDRDLFRMARSFLATDTDVLRTVALPGAIPAIAAGVRQGMMQSLLGVVVAEYFLGGTGVGGLIFQAGLTLRTGEALFGALVFAVAALVLSFLLRRVERRLDRWRTR